VSATHTTKPAAATPTAINPNHAHTTNHQALISSKAGRTAKVLRLFRMLQLIRVFMEFEAREAAREATRRSGGGGGAAAATPSAAANTSKQLNQQGGRVKRHRTQRQGVQGKGEGGRSAKGGGGGSGGGDAVEAALQRYRFTETRVGQKLSGV